MNKTKLVLAAAVLCFSATLAFGQEAGATFPKGTFSYGQRTGRVFVFAARAGSLQISIV